MLQLDLRTVATEPWLAELVLVDNRDGVQPAGRARARQLLRQPGRAGHRGPRPRTGIRGGAVDLRAVPPRTRHTADVRESPGAGLGLAIAHSIVVAHGGRIEVSSEEAVGTTMGICLPAAETVASREEPAP
jgi:hypothetical protein